MSGFRGRRLSRSVLASVVTVACSALVGATAPSTVHAGLRQAVRAHCVHPERAAKSPDANAVPPAVQAVAEKDFRGRLAGHPVTSRRVLATATVPVYWHTISAAGGAGRLSGTAIDQQITILNHAYAPVGLKFELAEVEDAVNTEWFYQVAPDSQEQTAMKKALRKGGADALNIYSTELSDSMRPIRGYATYPWRYRFAESDDGVVLRYTETGNLTAVHEVGHWAGLYSTYENGCSGPGDMVDDTPAQAFASSGCPEGRDTCSQRGTDPIHNFMDGNEDTCRNQFTPGQVERAREVLRVFRGIAT